MSWRLNSFLIFFSEMHTIKILALSLTVLPSIKIQAGVTCAIASRFIADSNTDFSIPQPHSFFVPCCCSHEPLSESCTIHHHHKSPYLNYNHKQSPKIFDINNDGVLPMALLSRTTSASQSIMLFANTLSRNSLQLRSSCWNVHCWLHDSTFVL